MQLRAKMAEGVLEVSEVDGAWLMIILHNELPYGYPLGWPFP